MFNSSSALPANQQDPVSDLLEADRQAGSFCLVLCCSRC